MFNSSKTFGIISLIFLAIVTTASTVFTGGKYKNLRVLPKDITEKQLDSIMDSYNRALKVSCDFCHTKAKKDLFSLTPPKDELDYALDIPMKEEARKMIRLQMDINKNYFRHDSTIKVEYMNVVSCNTCHRGNPFPAWE